METLIARMLIAAEVAPRSELIVDYDGRELTLGTEQPYSVR